MEYYDNMDNFNERIHTVQVTLQTGKYKGHIAFKVGGNCFGATLLEVPFEYHSQEEIDRYVINDCQLRLNEDYDCFEAVLKDDDGNELEIDDWDESDIMNSVVAIEFIDCKVNK